MLNYRYIEGMGPGEIESGTCAGAVRRKLRLLGYRFSSCATGYGPSDCVDIDGYLHDAGGGLSNFAQLVMNATPLEHWLRISAERSPYELHRQRILTCLEALPSHADNGVRDFVLAHVLSPHEPFVFGRDGEDVSPYDRPYSLKDIYADPDLPALPGRVGPEYARRYRAQAGFVGDRVLAVVDEILERSPFPPIIIVQGDHGPYGFSPDLRSAQFPILNAYHLPGDEAASRLYPAVTPVNTFRIVLNAYFGGEHALLADERVFPVKERARRQIRVPGNGK
jgi:hypothetical protein